MEHDANDPGNRSAVIETLPAAPSPGVGAATQSGWVETISTTTGIPVDLLFGAANVVVALAAVGLTVWVVYANRRTSRQAVETAAEVNLRIAREKATFDTILRMTWDRDYIAARRDFVRIRREPDPQQAILKIFLTEAASVIQPGTVMGQGAVVTAMTDELDRLRVAVVSVLNHYELIARAVEQKVLEESFLRGHLATSFLSDYTLCAPLIAHLRARKVPRVTATALAYEKVEALAIAWGGDPVDRIAAGT